MKNKNLVVSSLFATAMCVSAFASVADFVGKPNGDVHTGAEMFSGYPEYVYPAFGGKTTGFYFDAGKLKWTPELGSESELALSSIKLESANCSNAQNAGAGTYSGGLYAFLYEGSPTNITTSPSGTLLGVSTNSITWNSASEQNGSAGTWNFSGIKISTATDKIYSILFSSTKDSFTSPSGSVFCELYYETTDGTGYYKDAYSDGSFATSGNALNFTVNASAAIPMPEPSMFGVFAGLGALALVGARRRRRK